MLLKDGLVDPASTGLRDSQINEGMFAKGLTSIMISGEPGRLGLMNDPAQSKVAGQVAAILVPTASGKTRSYGLLEALAIPNSLAEQGGGDRLRQVVHEQGFPDRRTTSMASCRPAPRRWRSSTMRASCTAATCWSTQSKTVEALFPQGTPTWYPQFSSAVNTAINSAAKGQITVDQAMQNIADATKQAMAQ